MIADHAAGVGTGQRPHRKPVTFLGHVQQAESHVSHKRLVDDSHQGIPAAESIPKRKGGIEGPTLRDRDNILMEITITPVHVVPPVRSDHAVVKRGIEISCRLLASALNLD